MGSRIGFRIRLPRLAWAGCIVASVLGIASGGTQAIPQAALANSPSVQMVSSHGEDALHAMSRIADVIFAGQVIAIRRHEAANGATGVVEISFSVDDAIRGVGAGTYTMREWGGLWAGGYEPFRVGERYLMLLHAPGAAGLSSPVGGSDGAIPIRGDAESRVAGLSTLAAGAVVDLRWVATRTAHALSYQAEAVGRPTSLPLAVRANRVNAGQVDVAGPIESGPPAAEGEAYSTILGKLRSWQKTDNAAR